METEESTWLHYCLRDHSWFGVAVGEECNWCGKRESDPDQVERLTRISAADYEHLRQVLRA
jgi:hypothetical protein